MLHKHGMHHETCKATVVIITGLGSDVKSWTAVIRMLSTFTRVLFYDRSGYGKSEAAPAEVKSIAANIAKELRHVLDIGQVEPPYLLIGHSYGGVIVRELLQILYEENKLDYVHGMVFLEANMEDTLKEADWRKLAGSPVIQGLDIDSILWNKVRYSHLTDEELREHATIIESDKHRAVTLREAEWYESSLDELRDKRQLDMKPPILGKRRVCVVKGDTLGDFQKMFHAGIESGRGTEEERSSFLKTLSRWEEADRRLQKRNLEVSSGPLRYVELSGCGHDIHMTAPNIVADAVRWALDVEL